MGCGRRRARIAVRVCACAARREGATRELVRAALCGTAAAAAGRRGEARLRDLLVGVVELGLVLVVVVVERQHLVRLGHDLGGERGGQREDGVLVEAVVDGARHDGRVVARDLRAALVAQRQDAQAALLLERGVELLAQRAAQARVHGAAQAAVRRHEHAQVLALVQEDALGAVLVLLRGHGAAGERVRRDLGRVLGRDGDGVQDGLADGAPALQLLLHRAQLGRRHELHHVRLRARAPCCSKSMAARPSTWQTSNASVLDQVFRNFSP